MSDWLAAAGHCTAGMCTQIYVQNGSIRLTYHCNVCSTVKGGSVF